MDIGTIKKQLISYEDYLKLQIQPPYTYKLQKNNQHLYYFGANHTYETNDEQFDLLKKTWNEFIQKTNGQPRIALSEGGVRPAMESEAAAITKYGEAGLLSYLANRDNVEIQCPEVSRKEEISNLDNEFTKDEIQFYYFARMVAQWNRFDPKPEFEEYITKSLRVDEAVLEWTDYNFSLENMKAVHKKLFNEEFDENKGNFFLSITNPTIETTVINKFVKAEGVAKDAHIVKNTLEQMNAGKSIFIVYGFTHAVVQEPALRAYFS